MTLALIQLVAQAGTLAAPAGDGVAAAGALAAPRPTALDIIHNYLGVFIVAFLVTLFVTPLMRRLAIANGIIDRPNEARKVHRVPIAYLGGVAVFIGIMSAILFSYLGADLVIMGHPVELLTIHPSRFEQVLVPWSVLAGMALIMLAGVVDDAWGMMPRIKVAMQLLAAAFLAMNDIGTKVASGLLSPIGNFVGNHDLSFLINLPFSVPMVGPSFEIDLVYWSGTAIIAIFILGACNASNLIDGLDGLLTGVTAIAVAGLLVIALGLAVLDDGYLDSARIVLALSVLGACMGFLPHNFNPATIFQGDAGSLLLGYVTIVLVLTLGDTGKTHLVVAGLIIYSIPIIDTALAMVRRKMAGKPFSSADDQHLHHMLKRALGVRGAVFTLYLIGLVFAALGVWLSMGRVRVVFTIAMVLWGFIGVTAVKIARKQTIEAQALAMSSGSPPVPPVPAAGAKSAAASAAASPGATPKSALHEAESRRPSPVS